MIIITIYITIIKNLYTGHFCNHLIFTRCKYIWHHRSTLETNENERKLDIYF